MYNLTISNIEYTGTYTSTVRENVNEVSIDSTMNSSFKSIRKSRKNAKSKHVKSSEEDSDAVTKLSHISAKIPSSREIKKDQDQTLNESRDTSCVTKNNSKTSKVKRQTRTRKQQVSEASSTLSESECVDIKNDSKHSKKSNSSKSSQPIAEVSDNKVTPESSPVRIPPLPNRSTKTPKQSPSNLGSPKTHSRTALRSLNVPRKLTIDSPPSEVSNDSVTQQSVNESISNSKTSSKPKILSEKKNLTHSISKVKLQLSKFPKNALNNSKSNASASNKKSPSQKIFSKIEKMVKINLTDSVVLATSHPSESLSKSMKKQQGTSLKSNDSTKTSNLNTSIITSSSNINRSLLSEKTPSNLTTSKQHCKSRNHSLVKSKKSPKFVSSFTPGKTPKIALSSNAFKVKKCQPNKEKLTPKTEKSTSIKEKSLSKKEKSLSKNTKSQVKKSKNMNLCLDSTMSPIVVLNKLTASEIESYTPLKVKKTKIDQGSSSPKSLKKPLLVVTKSRTSIIKGPKKSNSTSQTSTPVIINKRISLLKPLTSSTPREKVKLKKLSLSTNIDPKISKKLNNQSTSSIKLLENESLPSMNNSSLVHLSAVYNTDDSENEITFEVDKNESNNKSRGESNSFSKHNENDTLDIEKSNSSSSSNSKKCKNDTYEVKEPKTPKFQNKSIKRKFTEIDDSVNVHQVAKKSCKVQFATPATKTREGSSGIHRQGTPGHTIHKRTPIVKRLQSSHNKQPFGNMTSSVIKTELKTPGNVSINRRLSISLSAVSASKCNKSSEFASSGQLSKLKPVVALDKKIVTKTPVGKIPNFAEIHRKKFEQMESLVDLKKRVEERHVTLNAPTSSTKKVSTMKRQCGTIINSEVSTNSTHNRFGWPLRKNEAVDMISKKQPSKVESSDKRREKARTALKGVRMNRRFELQMQSRMKKT